MDLRIIGSVPVFCRFASVGDSVVTRNIRTAALFYKQASHFRVRVIPAVLSCAISQNLVSKDVVNNDNDNGTLSSSIPRVALGT